MAAALLQLCVGRIFSCGWSSCARIGDWRRRFVLHMYSSVCFQVGEFAVNAEKRLFAILRPCIVLVGSEVQDLFLMGSCSRWKLKCRLYIGSCEMLHLGLGHFVEANYEVETVNCCGEVCDCRRMSPTRYKVFTNNGKEFLLFVFVPAQSGVRGVWTANWQLEACL